MGNSGSLLRDTAKWLANGGHTVIVSDVAEDILQHSAGEKFPVVVYVGGEVRDESLMRKKNYIFPSSLLSMVDESQGRFIYLSTLAVYPQYSSQKTIYPSLTQYEPRGTYGTSKAEFDYMILRSKYQCVSIQPASIIGARLNTSSLDRVLGVLLRFSILRFVNIDTVISFCERSSVIEMIGASVADRRIKGIQLVCIDVSVSTIQSEVYGEEFKPIISLGPLVRLISQVAGTILPKLESKLASFSNRTRFAKSTFFDVNDRYINDLIQCRLRLIKDAKNG